MGFVDGAVFPWILKSHLLYSVYCFFLRYFVNNSDMLEFYFAQCSISHIGNISLWEMKYGYDYDEMYYAVEELIGK